MRLLVKNIPNNILIKYNNIDNPMFNVVRNDSFTKCIENKFLEDVKEKTSLEIYNKIKIIYDKVIH